MGGVFPVFFFRQLRVKIGDFLRRCGGDEASVPAVAQNFYNAGNAGRNDRA